VGLLREVVNKLNPILDELNSEDDESKITRETDSSEVRTLLASSEKLAPLNSNHSQQEIYANICIRFEKVKKLFVSIDQLKINFDDEKLVMDLIRFISSF
jgi:anti-sigma28 factor (negative regulator of flagellin synthesis)